VATTSSRPSSTPSRPSRHWSYTRTAYCAMSSGNVVGTSSTCSWLPLRCCSASACVSSCCTVAGSSVPVVSTTGESSAGIGASCWAGAHGATSSSASPTQQARNTRSQRSRRGRRSAIRTEVDPWRLLDLLQVVDGEVRPRPVTEHLGGEVLRELPDEGVVVLHRADVALSFDGDAVLGAFELRLQLQEVLVGLGLRVVLGHQQQAADRALQLPLGLLELFKGCFIAGIHVDAAYPRARLGHLGEHLLLVLGIPARRRHQVGHQVGAPLVDVDDL